MINFEIIKDTNAPYGFRVEPKDKRDFKNTKYEMHLDTSYVRMWIDMQDRYFLFLFDKNKNFISWKQRQKECENFTVEEKIFEDGYKVIREREVKIIDEKYSDGREYIVDTLYLNNKFKTSKREIDIFPIDKIYNDYTNIRKNQEEYRLKRQTNQARYLDSNTFKQERIEILYEELACHVAMLAYHPMARDSDMLVDMTNYEEYEKLYYSKVPNKNENYIEYLKAYYEGLRASAIDDIAGEEELKLIKQKCKEANLENIF